MSYDPPQAAEVPDQGPSDWKARRSKVRQKAQGNDVRGTVGDRRWNPVEMWRTRWHLASEGVWTGWDPAVPGTDKAVEWEATA